VKKRKRSAFKPLLIGGGVLIGGLTLSLQFLGIDEENSSDAKADIEQAVAGIKDPRRRLERQVVLSVNQFRGKRGRLPARIQELVPGWFDAVPLDPKTKKPLEYRVEGNRFFIGDGSRNVAVEKGGGITDDEEDRLIASLDRPDHEDEYVYDPTGLRDPFTPIDFSVKVSIDTTVPPLQRFSLGQLKVSAILVGGNDPSAMVETQEGMGYPVKKGTKIGLDNGEVVEILSDKVVVREVTTDFSGAVSDRLVEMTIGGEGEGIAKKKGLSRPVARVGAKVSGR
jgi:Tfp pilus assembly protein PilP